MAITNYDRAGKALECDSHNFAQLLARAQHPS